MTSATNNGKGHEGRSTHHCTVYQHLDTNLRLPETSGGSNKLTRMLAGKTGSFLNLAPEVALNKSYNEKADVSSVLY